VEYGTAAGWGNTNAVNDRAAIALHFAYYNFLADSSRD
jgi:hypothetical protein